MKTENNLKLWYKDLRPSEQSRTILVSLTRSIKAPLPDKMQHTGSRNLDKNFLFNLISQKFF